MCDVLIETGVESKDQSYEVGDTDADKRLGPDLHLFCQMFFRKYTPDPKIHYIQMWQSTMPEPVTNVVKVLLSCKADNVHIV